MAVMITDLFAWILNIACKNNIILYLLLYNNKNIFQKCRGMYIQMAVPKTTETRYRDSSVQARQVIMKTTQVTPSLNLFLLHNAALSNLIP